MAAIVLVSSLAVMAAGRHEVTHKGTAIGADAKTLQVNVVNEKTKKVEPMTFKHDGETHVFRGETQVTFAEARIQKGEAISVTVDHDEDPLFALEVHLGAR